VAGGKGEGGKKILSLLENRAAEQHGIIMKTFLLVLAVFLSLSPLVTPQDTQNETPAVIPEGLRAAKTIRLVVEQDLGKEAAPLPVRRRVSPLLEIADLTLLADGEDTTADITLQVRLSGSLLSAAYHNVGVQATGGRLSGTTWVEYGREKFLEKRFKDELKISRTVGVVSGYAVTGSPLYRLMNQSPFLADVLEILVTIRPNGKNLLTSCLTGGDSLLRRAAVQVLGRSGVPAADAAMKDPAITPILTDMFSERRTDWRVDEKLLLKALARSSDPQALDPLLKRAHSILSSSRILALQALANIRDPRSTQALIEALDDKERKVRMAAIRGLAYKPGAKAANALAQIAIDAQNEMRKRNFSMIYEQKVTQQAALDSLEKMPTLVPLDRLLPLVAKENAGKVVRSALAAGADPQPLLDFLPTASPWPRFEVMKILGEFKVRRAVEPLIEMLRSRNKGFRRIGRQTLIQITGRDLGLSYRKWSRWWKKEKEEGESQK